MLKKKNIIIFSLVIVLLTATAVTIIHYLELNRLKPVISQIVKQYTGRDLTINGDIRLLALWPPTLAVEDAAFQNAPWGSHPHMIRVKRAALGVSLTSLLRGEFRFFKIRLDEPQVLLEFNSEGESNFLLDIPATEGDGVIPVLAFNDILIQNGNFEYNDRKHDLKASVHVDDLEADIPGLDKPIQIMFEGNFRDLPLSLDGSIGPIIAWIQPGNTLPVNLSTRLGRASARLEGAIKNPVQLKDISLVFRANGPSTREMAKLINWGSIPDLGAFTVEAELTDRPGQLAIDNLNAIIGSPEHVSFSVGGRIDDLVAMQALDLNLGIQTNHTGNLMLLTGLTAPPFEAPLTARVRLSDTTKNQYRLDDFLVSVGDRIIEGRMDLNLARAHSVLDMQLQSEHPTLGPVAFKTRMRGSSDRISVEHLELHMGHDNLFKAFIVGAIENLSPLEGLHLKFNIVGNDLAHLEKVAGRPLPVHGPFALSGALLMADRQTVLVPDLKIILDKSSINGSLGVELGKENHLLHGDLASNRLNLAHLLTPGTLPDNLQKNLSSVGPSRLTFEVSGPVEQPVLDRIEIQTRVEDLATLNIKGSIENLLAMAGTDLHFKVKGSELKNLKKVVGQDIPFKGPFTISGRLINPFKQTYHFENLEITAPHNTFSGRSIIQLSELNTTASVKLATDNISLKALVEGQNAVLDRLRSKKDLGPFDIAATTILSEKGYRLQSLDLSIGKDDFVHMQVEGSVGNLSGLQNMQLGFQISGRNISSIESIAGRSVPIQGPYALSGEVSGHAPHNIMLRNLGLTLGENRFAGQANLNLAGKHPMVESEISTDNFSLALLSLEKADRLKDLPDLGPLKLAFKLSEEGGEPAITHFDLQLGRESTLAVMLRGTIGNLNPIGEVTLDFAIDSQDLSILNQIYGNMFIKGWPFHAMGRLDDPRLKKITVTSLKTIYGDNDVYGTASLDLAGDRPSLVAQLSSHMIDLRPFIKKFKANDPAPHTPAQSHKPKDHVFSHKPFDLTLLHRINAHVSFEGQEILFEHVAFDDVTIRLNLKDGDLNIDPLKFGKSGGSTRGTFSLQSSQTPLFLATSLTIDLLDIGPMLKQLGQDSSLEGTLNTSIFLNSRGNSLAALMAGLTGKVNLDIHDGQIQSKHLALLERYLGSNILDLINPFIRRPPYTTINCLISHADIEEGNTAINIILDTEQSALVSAGLIDLKTERLNIGIKPSPKKGFGDQHSGYITFSLKELSQPFSLGGTLTRPRLVLDPTRTVTTAAKFAGALALGPWGLTWFFSDISLGKKNICEEATQAMGKK